MPETNCDAPLVGLELSYFRSLADNLPKDSQEEFMGEVASALILNSEGNSFRIDGCQEAVAVAKILIRDYPQVNFLSLTAADLDRYRAQILQIRGTTGPDEYLQQEVLRANLAPDRPVGIQHLLDYYTWKRADPKALSRLYRTPLAQKQLSAPKNRNAWNLLKIYAVLDVARQNGALPMIISSTVLDRLTAGKIDIHYLSFKDDRVAVRRLLGMGDKDDHPKLTNGRAFLHEGHIILNKDLISEQELGDEMFSAELRRTIVHEMTHEWQDAGGARAPVTAEGEITRREIEAFTYEYRYDLLIGDAPCFTETTCEAYRRAEVLKENKDHWGQVNEVGEKGYFLKSVEMRKAYVELLARGSLSAWGPLLGWYHVNDPATYPAYQAEFFETYEYGLTQNVILSQLQKLEDNLRQTIIPHYDGLHQTQDQVANYLISRFDFYRLLPKSRRTFDDKNPLTLEEAMNQASRDPYDPKIKQDSRVLTNYAYSLLLACHYAAVIHPPQGVEFFQRIVVPNIRILTRLVSN